MMNVHAAFGKAGGFAREARRARTLGAWHAAIYKMIIFSDIRV